MMRDDGRGRQSLEERRFGAFAGRRLAAIARSCASVPRRRAYSAPPIARRLAAANDPSGPLNTYCTSWRSTLRSNGRLATDVVTVATSSPSSPTTERHGGSHSRTTQGTVARTPANDIVTVNHTPGPRPPTGAATDSIRRSHAGSPRGSLVTAQTSSGGASTSTEYSTEVIPVRRCRWSSPATTRPDSV